MIAVFGVKGSPGATVTAVLTAALWPTDAGVVEADPAGADLPLRMVGPSGQALPSTPSIAELAIDASAGAAVGERFWAHALRTSIGVPVVLGLPSPEPMEETITRHGSKIASALRSQEHLVVDCGRVTPRSPALVFAAAADVVVLVVPDSAEGAFHARDVVGGLVAVSARDGGVRSVVVPIVIAEQRRQAAATQQLEQVLRARGLACAGPAWLAHDDRAAAQFLTRGLHGLEKSQLVRSGRAVVERLVGVQHDLRSARGARHAGEERTPAPGSGPRHHAAAQQAAQLPPQPPRHMAWPPAADGGLHA